MAAASAIEASPAASPGDVAAARLLTGDWDGAVDEWTRILRQGRTVVSLDNIVEQSTDARSLSDLACAYYERSRAKNRPIDLIVAAAIADRAFRIGPEIPAHAWNRALTMEALGIRSEAAKSWRDYLAIDPASEWATEAKLRLRTLEAETDSETWASMRAIIDAAVTRGDTARLQVLTRQFPVRVRALVDDEWIPQWAAAQDSGAQKLFAAIEAVAIGLKTGARDEFLADFVGRARTAADFRAFTMAHGRMASVAASLR